MDRFRPPVTDAIGNEDIRDLGWAVNDANVELIAKYGSASYAACNVKMYLLLGDPALEVRLEEPNYSPETISPSPSTLIVIPSLHNHHLQGYGASCNQVFWTVPVVASVSF